MESLKKIRALLEKFYQGQTSREEEKLLGDFFRDSSIPSEMLPDKELFLSIREEVEEIDIPDDLNKRIIKVIDNAEQKELRTRRIGVYSLSGLAAGLLILISVYLFFLKEIPDTRLSGNSSLDTYEDPMVAYEEVKKTLAYVSSKFNEGTSELKYMRQMDRTVGTLQPLTFISRGNKEIRLLQQLEKAQDISRQ